jgi:putative PIN family toxin of toxin-antitoxin system
VRVVLDTNVAVSALLFERGRLAWIRALWFDGRIAPLINRATLDELVRVLGYPKFGLDPEDVEAVLAAYVPYATTVTVAGPVAERLPRCRDPHDQPFLTLALAGRAEVLVSGDRALLALAGRTPFVIEAPERFRARFP